MLTALILTSNIGAGWYATVAVYEDNQHLCDVTTPGTYSSEPEAYTNGRLVLAKLNDEEIQILEAKK